MSWAWGRCAEEKRAALLQGHPVSGCSSATNKWQQPQALRAGHDTALLPVTFRVSHSGLQGLPQAR